MNNKSRLQNIENMESIFNELNSSLKNMQIIASKRKKLLPKYNKLMNYYESEQRQKDYDDINNWKLKPICAHWILSEDAIYDFYQEQRKLADEIIKTASKYLK